MPELRQRRRRAEADASKAASKGRAVGDYEDFAKFRWSDVFSLAKGVWWLFGVVALVGFGYWFSSYVQALHENQLWFSNIKEVEREISLRTESGLYYSYYKQLIRAANVSQGFRDLTVDNVTEHGRTINVLQRFNIYQEVLLAWLYRNVEWREGLAPILFYVYACFRLTGLYAATLAAVAWQLTGNLLAAAATAALCFANLEDMTRAFFTVNLRETFAAPFLWLNILCVCVCLQRRPDSAAGRLLGAVCQVGALVSGFLFAVAWQFNQFVFLLQALSLYALALLQLAPRRKLVRLMLMPVVQLLAVYALQFGQPMLLGSFVLSFVFAALATFFVCGDVRLTSSGIVAGAFKLVFQAVFTLVLAVSVNVATKWWLQLRADAHIYKFLKGKFGLENPHDFESRIYLCHGAFAFIDNGFFVRTSVALALPLFALFVVGALFVMGKDVLQQWCAGVLRQPSGGSASTDARDPTARRFFFNGRADLAYLTVQSMLSCVVAVLALRMKYIWFAHMAVLGSVLLGDAQVVGAALAAVRVRSKFAVDAVRHALPAAVVAYLLWGFLPNYHHQMDDLKEFWDPDTVQLMEWIERDTARDASFTGSMQLMAGIKCCTGRPLLNHPHFEDAWLRERTLRLYQVYGRVSAERAHDLLRAEKAQYVVLEDSICLAPSDGCRLPDLIDLANGHAPDNERGFEATGLVRERTPRFCDAIRHGGRPFDDRFAPVFQNPTFRVYRVL